MKTHVRKNNRGQVLPLACVSLIFLALMTMLSFNITNVIHEKIRLQNYSDSQAFSMATVEARAFNYLAYSNRASAAAFVTIASLHGYLAVANMAPQLFRAAGVAMIVAMLAELAVCIVSWGSSPCCSHIATPAQLIFQYFTEDANDAEDTLQKWEKPFNDAVKALWGMVANIHLEQDLMLGGAVAQVTTGFDGALTSQAKLASKLPIGVGTLNAAALTCSLEGSTLDSCSAYKTVSERSQLYTEIINASTPRWNHNITLMGTDYLPFIGDKWSDLTLAMPAFFGGDHAIADSSCSPGVGDEGQLACGKVPFAMFMGIAEDMPGVGGWAGSEISSDDSGGDHSPDGADDDHDEFKGIPKCVEDKKCFINFRLDEDDKKTWGQPSVYAYYSSDLSKRRSADSSTPWLLGGNGKLSIEMGAKHNGNAGVLEMKPERTGAAMSRALVYFHAPGSWPRPPNFFDPFWGAKLHTFDRAGMVKVLTVAAATDDKMADIPAAVVVEGSIE